jgi:alkylation response protein AidB-like acyl-CoA dehydrogenase
MRVELPPGVDAIRAMPRGLGDDVAAAIALARRFCDEVVRPSHRAIDQRAEEEPGWVPREIVHAANAWGLYTAWLPRAVGGGGGSMLSLYAFLEEVATVCVGVANVVGVHYLGVTTLCATWNMRLVRRVLGEVVAGERRGEPCLVSLAITEPAAGTDMEETELLARIRPGTIATRAPGGYRVRGRKVFISNGHVSTWHVVICCEEPARAAETGVVLAVKDGAPGFALGRVEHKMGQKACVASELVFDDCVVPDAQVAIDRRQAAATGAPPREVFQQVIDYVVSSTRAGVGAFGAGVARGAYLAACEVVRRRRPDGTRPVDDQCVRMRLADLRANAELARLAWQEAAWANCAHGLFRDLHRRGVYELERRLPRRLIAAVGPRVLDQAWTTRLLRRRHLARYPRAAAELTSGWGSLAKVVGSDLAVASADLALELCGPDGTREGAGIEKRIRDAKLLQIYEGTNQLNRLNLFKCLVGAGWSDVEVFA